MIILLTLLLSFFPDDVIFHEYHLSNTEVRYNEKENSLQITTRIFIDDLEETLGKKGHSQLFLCTEREPSHAEALVEDYLKSHLLFKVDEVEQEFTYLGKEISDDLIAVWCYLEILDVTPSKLIEIENNILLESFDDQKNIVNVKTDSGKRAMFILQNGRNRGSLKL